MIFWLDNQENTNDVHNENYGRELLELFSMGIGNYTEDDVKDCARAFTGWGLKNMLNERPFGRIVWQFEFHPELARLRREDLPWRDRQLRRRRHHRYHRPPAGHRPVHRQAALPLLRRGPADQAAVDGLAEVYLSPAARSVRWSRRCYCPTPSAPTRPTTRMVKSPAEHVVGLMRLVGDYQLPRPTASSEIADEFTSWARTLMNPPSVEGWHTGKEWIDTGILVERINFAAAQVGDPTSPGVRRSSSASAPRGELSRSRSSTHCLELVGPLRVRRSTRTRWSTTSGRKAR